MGLQIHNDCLPQARLNLDGEGLADLQAPHCVRVSADLGGRLEVLLSVLSGRSIVNISHDNVAHGLPAKYLSTYVWVQNQKVKR